jgi:hypothetical protein
MPHDSQRIQVAPADLAVVTSSAESGALPAMAGAGGHATGTVVILVRFPTPWGNQRIAGAFLVLGPHFGARPEPHAVRLSVARILDRWVGTDVTWGRLPPLSPAEITATIAAAPAEPLRIDVTHIAQRWAYDKPDDHGIAIVASADGPCSPGYATGTSGGIAPRLDVYVR